MISSRTQSFGVSWALRWLFVLLFWSATVAAEEEGSVGPVAFVRGKFNSLDDRGKLIAGAAAGFVGSRIVVGSAMTVVKVGAAAFLT